ncbi:unnamed protein product [Parnassius mnemosyne]|uniref:CCHC-type domain-containing protein n=1 Tax=Parnassius mnemosyne TaxID=213953 RepID=A0AAV1L252_9NEOP
MSVGKISEFDVKTGNWTAYVERLEMYFVANSVKDEIKLPTLIAAMGESAYELLSTLASPKKPAELTYLDAVVLLRNHLQPKPSPMAERYRFRQRRQTDTESISDYVAALKKLSRHCEFGAVLQDNLRDQLVCGLRSDVIRQRLFAEEKLLSYDKAVILAGSLEAAERDAALVESGAAVTSSQAAGQLRGEGGGRANGGLNAMRVCQRARHTWHSAVAGSGGGGVGAGRADVRGSLCGACGGVDHVANECKFRTYICSKCGVMGHLRRVCFTNNQSVAPGAYNGNAANVQGFGKKSRNNGRGGHNQRLKTNYVNADDGATLSEYH